MANYIDGFVFPLPKAHLDTYQSIAEKVAAVWKAHGALAYFEYVGDDLYLEGTRSFTEVVALKIDEVIIFGWVVFPSKEVRDKANEAVPNDPNMVSLVAPLMQPERVIFDASRMVYGGFKKIVQLM